MKNRSLFAAIATFGTMLFSMTETQAFQITGTFKNHGKIRIVYLQKAQPDGSFKNVGSSRLDPNGKYSITYSAPYADLYKLKADALEFDIAARETDKIELNSDISDPQHAYTLIGSEPSARIMELKKQVKVYTDKNREINEMVHAKTKNGGSASDSLVQAYLPEFRKNNLELGQRVIAFIEENKNSLAGYFAIGSADPLRYEPQLIKYSESIPADLQANPAIRSFIASMKAAKALSVGQVAPDFALNDMDGKKISLADFKGKYLLVDFWASWCVPCRQENPNLIAQYERYGPKGLNIVGISLDKDRSAWKKAVNDDKLRWTQASDLQGFEGPVERKYHIQAIPSNFVIGPDGTIVAKNLRGPDLEEYLQQTFNK